MELNLSRVAFAYDRLRVHPPGVSGKLATAISAPVERVFKEPHFLEIGVGTGRVALPLIARGYRYTALDQSEAMLAVFRHKIAGVGRKVRILSGDACDLPLMDDSVQAVVSVHVWHQIEAWEKALAEVQRVLKPGGFLFEGWDEAQGENEDYRIQEAWRIILDEMGYQLKRGLHTHRRTEVLGYLMALGLDPKLRIVATWTEQRTSRQSLEALAERLYSFTWQVPEALFRCSMDELYRWALAHYPDLDRPHPLRWRFILRASRLP